MAYLYPGSLGETDFADGSTNSGWQISSFIYGGAITTSGAGTVTQLSAKMRTTGGSVGIKLGLYNSSGTRLGQTTATITSGTLGWVNSGAVSISVPSAGTYYVLVSGANNDDPVLGYDTTGTGSYATEAYATAMAATETITSDDTNKMYGVRMDFTSGAAAASLVIPPRAAIQSILSR